jgi:hypothetical protein
LGAWTSSPCPYSSASPASICVNGEARNNIGNTATTNQFEKAQASPLPEQSQSIAGINGGLLELPLQTQSRRHCSCKQLGKDETARDEEVMHYVNAEMRQYDNTSVRQ